MPDDTLLLLQTLQALRDDVAAIRGALDKDRDERFAEQSIVNARLDAHDATLRTIEAERERERTQRTGLILMALTAIASAAGGFVTWLVERLIVAHH